LGIGHDQHGSPAALLVDECKSVRDEILDTLSRCHVTWRLYASSTGPAAGGFYRICTVQAHLWRTFRVSSEQCEHVSKAEIEADRENLKDSVFRIKHAAEWLYDAGESMISLEAVWTLLADPPKVVAGKGLQHSGHGIAEGDLKDRISRAPRCCGSD
jgi:hypothetical protein